MDHKKIVEKRKIAMWFDILVFNWWDYSKAAAARPWASPCPSPSG
jgi:hypothetical protein